MINLNKQIISKYSTFEINHAYSNTKHVHAKAYQRIHKNIIIILLPCSSFTACAASSALRKATLERPVLPRKYPEMIPYLEKRDKRSSRVRVCAACLTNTRMMIVPGNRKSLNSGRILGGDSNITWTVSLSCLSYNDWL